MIALLALLLAQDAPLRPNTDPGVTPFEQQLRPHVSKFSGQIKYCYETQLKSNAELKGRIEIAMRVEGGEVTSSTVESNTTGDVELGECIARKVGYWRLPPELSGQAVYPFVFEPALPEAPAVLVPCRAQGPSEVGTHTFPGCLPPATDQ